MDNTHDNAAKNDCECPACGKDFTTKKACSQATCPFCDHQGCNDMEFPEDGNEDFSKLSEMVLRMFAATNSCTCPECGKDFESKKSCPTSTCPKCGHKGTMMSPADKNSDMMNAPGVWEEFTKAYPEAADLDEFPLLTEKAIVVKEGKQWCIRSERTGKRLGCYPTKPAAQKRLKQIEMFRHMKSDKAEKEFAKQECECTECGAIYWTPGTCDDSYCPVCHAGPGENEELTGIL